MYVLLHSIEYVMCVCSIPFISLFFFLSHTNIQTLMISFSLFLSIYFAQTPEEREKGGEKKKREREREKEREKERERVCEM